MIYLPIELTSSNCVYVYDKDTIRVYDNNRFSTGTFSYTDYYVNSHYLARTGSTTFSNYSNNYPICSSISDFTTNFWYRNDLPDILISFAVIFGFTLFFIGFICKTFFRGLFN